MNKKQMDRMNRLMPNGKPKYIRVYDNDGRTADRYTVVFTGNYNNKGSFNPNWQGNSYLYIGMSAYPYHPQGFCCHAETEEIIDVNKSGWAPAIGRENHLGKRITFDSLSDDCKRVVIEDYKEIWSLS